jgi:hypothetical protein
MELESFAHAIERLRGRGFERSLRARHGMLEVVETGTSLAPESLAIDEIVRFEGETDPAEELVLFALLDAAGAPLGTYAALYGPSTSAEDAEVIHRLG